MSMGKINTSYRPAPVPTRDQDWIAVFDSSHEPGDPIGYGSTEQEAIDDLMSQVES